MEVYEISTGVRPFDLSSHIVFSVLSISYRMQPHLAIAPPQDITLVMR